jgi:uncharacterized protein (TIGR00255 family)
MIRSMTGYSRVRREESDFALTVSVKSVNHRFLDLQFRLPAGLDSLEIPIRRLIKERVARGHLEVQVGLERKGGTTLQVDRKLLEAYVAAWRDVRAQFGSAAEPDVVSLLRVPGMVAAGNGEIPPAELERIERALVAAMGEALERLNEMRSREGAALRDDLRARFARLTELCEGVAARAGDVAPLYRRRLEKRLADIAGGVEVDPGRVAQEVAVLVCRSDISEELTRFRSHLEQAARLVEEGAEVAKKLDFLLQELNREANTLLSKTTDVPEVGLEISRQAIEMKAEIEKLREQTQNLE